MLLALHPTLRWLNSGRGHLESYFAEKKGWPAPLFVPNEFCYGLIRIKHRSHAFLVSFSWKGPSLSVVQRAKYTELNATIEAYLHADVHFEVVHPNDLMQESIVDMLPKQRRPSLRQAVAKLEVESAVQTALDQIRSDTTPFNWMICGYKEQMLVLKETGTTGLKALTSGIGRVATLLQEEAMLYLYLRVNVPAQHDLDTKIPKYVLISWTQGDTSSSIGAMVAAHARDIYKLFPHHVHFFASTLLEVTEEIIEDRLRRAIDRDCMLLRIVCWMACSTCFLAYGFVGVRR